MKDLINTIEFKLLAKKLAASGSAKNISINVKGNVVSASEISFVDNNKNLELDISSSKEDGVLDFTVKGCHDHKLLIKELTVSGNNGALFSMQEMELNSIAEALELFTSIAK